MRNLTFLALPALMLGGCATTPDPIGGAPGLEVVEGQLPAPTQADIYDVGAVYPVGPFDTLRIDVFGIPELSGRIVRVNANGQIGFPLIGNIDVIGLSLTEISALIEARLRGQYVRDPQVTTNLEASETRTVTVFGQVQLPGVYPIVGRSNLIKAVATARGLAEFADARDVVVFRTVDGQRMATLYNLDAISRGLYENPQIYANDTIVVGDSEARRLFQDIVGAATLIATPLTILLQQ
jgi:polysaccharide biosynthesis/export protein